MLSHLQSYVKWVRENSENAASLQRMTRMFALITVDPRNLIGCEFSWTLVELHAFSNSMILATAGRRVRFSERIAILSKIICELECLVELLLRRFAGHAAAWRGLLALQSVKCVLDLLVHRQLFLVPWIWAAVRRWARAALQRLQGIAQGIAQGRMPFIRLASLSLLSPLPSPRGAGGEEEQEEGEEEEEKNNNDVSAPSRGGADRRAGPGNALLVIPRVAARRVRSYSAADGTHNALTAGREESEDRSDSEEEKKNPLPCTFLDVLGLVIDIIMLLRPLVILYCAKRVFPKDAAAIAAIAAIPQRSSLGNANKSSQQHIQNAPASAASAASGSRETMFLMDAVLRDGSAASLMSNWGVWLSFTALDAVLALVARYIRRYRVPVVYINDTSEEEEALPLLSAGAAAAAGGEMPSAGQEERSVELREQNNGIHDGDNIHDAAALAPEAPLVSRDSLRVKQAMRNLALSLLRDPFFPAVLQKPLYDTFVMGRINRIPILGPLLGYKVAYFLCKQHYAFVYSLGM